MSIHYVLRTGMTRLLHCTIPLITDVTALRSASIFTTCIPIHMKTLGLRSIQCSPTIKHYSKNVQSANDADQTGEQNDNQAKTLKKRTLQGGVIVVDDFVGDGVEAKSGKTISVYYSGRLKSSNKTFDENTSGAGFAFRLGRGEVIQGWDVGVAGMKVGGKRTITCPPEMAYGPRGFPPVIPPNSTLVFEVELKSVK